MKTFDGVEIKIGDYLYNHHGEELLVDELFPETNDNHKLVVIPQFLVKSMEPRCYGGEHCEISVSCDFEAEPAVVEAKHVFSRAPTAKIDGELEKKKAELKELAARIGIAKITVIEAEKEASAVRSNLNDLKDTLEKERVDAIDVMKNSIAKLTSK